MDWGAVPDTNQYPFGLYVSDQVHDASERFFNGINLPLPHQHSIREKSASGPGPWVDADDELFWRGLKLPRQEPSRNGLFDGFHVHGHSAPTKGFYFIGRTKPVGIRFNGLGR